jgi:hypothetical protein
VHGSDKDVGVKRSGSGAGPVVSEESRDRFRDLMKEWDERKSDFDTMVSEHVNGFNDLYREMNIPAVIVKDE